jgi:hypothetical protein
MSTSAPKAHGAELNEGFALNREITSVSGKNNKLPLKVHRPLVQHMDLTVRFQIHDPNRSVGA